MYQSPIEENQPTYQESRQSISAEDRDYAAAQKEELIEKYLEKIQVMEDSVTVIKEMIDAAMKGDTKDIEDLRKEMAIATDIRMYSKFIKDLENLIG